jgi:hypothetical protein
LAGALDGDGALADGLAGALDGGLAGVGAWRGAVGLDRAGAWAGMVSRVPGRMASGSPPIAVRLAA